jgi:uncharacterized protein YlzI (FlbEa/FlbD family)
MKLIDFLDNDNHTVWVNPQHVEGVTKDSQGNATIHLISGNSVPTCEPADAVVRKLLQRA